MTATDPRGDFNARFDEWFSPARTSAVLWLLLLLSFPGVILGDQTFVARDFGLFSSFRDNLSRGSFEGIAQAMSMDWIYGDPTTLITFLQNHDVGPDNDFRFRFKGEQWMAAAATHSAPSGATG